MSWLIKAVGLQKTFVDHGKATTVIREASFALGASEFVMVVGPSGSGKSTLLYLLSGLRNPTAGSVWVEGRLLADFTTAERAELRRRHFGFVVQQHLLAPYLNCLENVCLARSSRCKKEAASLLSELGLAEHLHKYPRELSFGERQRVALARGLVHRPKVLFADEPTASVNRELAGVIVDYIKAYCQAGGSCVMVTHDLQLLPAADRTLKMENGILIALDGWAGK